MNILPPSVARRRCAFTLVELLVVIAIICLLTAIIFPVFAQAREKARQTSCSSNEKQLGLAFQQYVSDYDEFLPVPADTSVGTTNLWMGVGWAGPLYPYVKSTQVFKCPDDTASPVIKTAGAITYTLSPISYAYNGNLMGYRGGNWSIGILGNTTKLDAPSSTVLLCEENANSNAGAAGQPVADLSTPNEAGDAATGIGGSPGIYVGGVCGSYLQGGNLVQLSTGYMGGSTTTAARLNDESSTCFNSPTGRHSAGSNFLLYDGHVKWMRGDFVATGGAAVNVNGYTSQPTDAPDVGIAAYGQPTAAGTAYPGFQATFSPM